MNLKAKLAEAVNDHKNIYDNIERKKNIQEVVDNKEALIAECGALATWTPVESTGRSPKDTVIVRRSESEDTVDWSSPNNIPIDEETFNMVFEDALNFLADKEKVYVTDRVLGADVKYALAVKVITDHALSSLFTDNMFRPIPENIEKSVFYNNGFYLLSLPYDKLDASKYEGRLRKHTWEA
jgi:phosphoenolpyruvate carboxykinase (ATP)